ncbi:hypothetical protein, partial [Flavobacterium sp.]|uniref:hypothetical protein n=1 Tax=Flavobacterium sp. TaxID=239 RepID=UPI0025C41AA7
AVRSPKSVVPRALLLLLRRGKSKPRWQATNQNQSLRQRSCRKKQNERSSFIQVSRVRESSVNTELNKKKKDRLTTILARMTATSLLQKKT